MAMTWKGANGCNKSGRNDGGDFGLVERGDRAWEEMEEVVVPVLAMPPMTIKTHKNKKEAK